MHGATATVGSPVRIKDLGMQKRFHHYCLIKQFTSKPLQSVYLAHHIDDPSKQVVIKVFDAASCNSKSLLQKAEAVKQLKYTHIIPVLDCGIEQKQPYIVSAYLPSGSLRLRLDRLSSQILDLQEALPIIFQVGRALRYAHQHNVLHGNIKPENVFFDVYDRALLGDFCVLDSIDVTKLDKSDPHATCYLAPEQLSGTLNEKSDQYALACLAYELITGHRPSSAQNFPPMRTKQNTQQAVPFSDLPHLPEQAEEVLLKAMAKEPSERYANISIFIRSLEALALLPTSALPHPSTTPAGDTSAESAKEPVAHVSTVAPVVARLLGHSEQISGRYRINESLDVPSGRASRRPSTRHRSSGRTLRRPPSKILDTPSGKTTVETSTKVLDVSSSHAMDTPPTKIVDTASSKVLDISSTRAMDTPPTKTVDALSSKTVDTPPSRALAILTEDRQAEFLAKGGFSQPHKPLTPMLWVAFALSGIAILMGTIMLYAFVPPRSPASSNPRQSSPNNHLTPVLVVPGQSVPDIETYLACGYTEQTSSVYNLTNQGTLDWIQWGLNIPEDVNHKLAVQQQISSFTLIGTGVIQRDSRYPNTYTWSDGTPILVAPPQQPSGVYVTGTGNGFTFTVAASTTPRTLRVYVGVVHAQGDFWAGINGRTVADTSLDTRNGPLVGANGIYTLTFSSNVPDQVLTVKYTVGASNANNGYVMLEAATLQD
jgi:serine/threonine protein kinase